MVCSMSSKEAWLNEGLAVLSELGVSSLRIDRLAERLKLSKGSFYHHFAGISGYRLDLLSHYEGKYTDRYIDEIEAQPGLSPRAKYDQLQRAVLSEDGGRPDLDLAIRAWAAQDDDARLMQARVDARRIEYLTTLWEEITGDHEDAVDMGRLIYLLLIGAQQIVPSLSSDELSRVYDVALRGQNQELAR